MRNVLIDCTLPACAMALDHSRQRLRENIEQQQPPYFFIDREVLQRCWPDISPFLNIGILLPRLIGYGFFSSDEVSELNSAHTLPGRKKLILYECAIGRERPHLLYMCVCHGSAEHLGHDDVRETLERTGKRYHHSVLIGYA